MTIFKKALYRLQSPLFISGVWLIGAIARSLMAPFRSRWVSPREVKKLRMAGDPHGPVIRAGKPLVFEGVLMERRWLYSTWRRAPPGGTGELFMKCN